MAFRAIHFCRLCTGVRLDDIWDLGEQAVADFPFAQSVITRPVLMVPLRLVRCVNCGLVQLAYTVDREAMYENYYYRSGVSKTMREALEGVVYGAMARVELRKWDAVLDIGCNDGELLNNYSNHLTRIGIDPSNITAAMGRGPIINAGVPPILVHNYFSYGAVSQVWRENVKIITSVAMFYDVDRPLDFMADVADVLHPSGVWVNQLNYVPSIMENNAFDFISHEHLTYWDMTLMGDWLAKVGLEIFDVELLPLNGGTARFYIQHKGVRPVTKQVSQMREIEKDLRGDGMWRQFRQRIDLNGEILRNMIEEAKRAGKVVAVLGASTRGNSLLQYYGLGVEQLPYASDRDPAKWGRKMVRTDIPIISEEEARARKPDYFLVLPYSYIDEIAVREKEYLSNGGKLIVPLPWARVVE